MRYPPGHKLRSRARLVGAMAARAKASGFGATGLQSLAAAADVTTGALYSQFASKADLLQAIVEYELSQTARLFEGQSRDGVVRALAGYLSPRHVDHPEQGCAIPTLGAEIARADPRTRATFDDALERIHASIAAATSDGDGDAAWAAICQAVGAVLVARAVARPGLRQAVLDAAWIKTQDLLAGSSPG